MIILNWKMNLTISEATNLSALIAKHKDADRVIIAPPVPYLAYLNMSFPEISFCAQDISVFRGYGSYTGEFSANMIKSVGVDYAILGHSERRHHNWENNKIVKKKIENAINAAITPIICVGETIESRQANNYKDFIRDQIVHSLPENIAMADRVIVAYEPVWAVGSGIKPSYEEIAELLNFIKFSEEMRPIAKKLKLIYGGSVDAKNIEDILKIQHLEGVMIGAASLNFNEIEKILNLNYINIS